MKERLQHWVILPTALLAAFFLLLPHLVFVQKLGADYRGIPRFVTDEGWYYLARARETLDGHATIGNPYLGEHKEKPPAQFFVPDWLEARLIHLLGLDIPAGFMVLIPVLGFAVSILLYAAVWTLTHSRLAGVLASAFVTLGLFGRDYNHPTVETFVLLFWYAEFFALLAFVRAEKRSRKLYAANVASLGALFYIYPFFWMFYIMMIGVLFIGPTLFRFLQKTILRTLTEELPTVPVRLKDIFFILGGALLIGVPYFYATWQAANLPEYQETLSRIGVLFTHFPSGVKIVVPAALLCMIFAFLRRRNILLLSREAVFLLGGVMALVVAANQHVLTGLHYEPSLHYNGIAMVWFAVTVAYLAAGFVKAFPKTLHIVRWAAVFAVALIVSRTLFTNAVSYFDIAPRDRDTQRFRPVLEWLEANTKKDEVVYANEPLSALIPVFTSDNVFFYRSANLFFMSDREVLDRYALNHYFDPIDETYIRKDERAVLGAHWVHADGRALQKNKLRKVLGLAAEPLQGLPQAEVKKVLKRFEELKAGSFESQLKQFRLDWLVWDRVHDPGWSAVDQSPFLKKTTEVGEFVIYRVR